MLKPEIQAALDEYLDTPQYVTANMRNVIHPCAKVTQDVVLIQGMLEKQLNQLDNLTRADDAGIPIKKTALYEIVGASMLAVAGLSVIVEELAAAMKAAQNRTP